MVIFNPLYFLTPDNFILSTLVFIFPLLYPLHFFKHFLNALSGFIPLNERIITIEDSAELQIKGIENLVRLETRNANIEGCVPISIRDLIKSSLRMRPDRIIVGEVRGSEAIDMIQALNTGHLVLASLQHYSVQINHNYQLLEY